MQLNIQIVIGTCFSATIFQLDIIPTYLILISKKKYIFLKKSKDNIFHSHVDEVIAQGQPITVKCIQVKSIFSGPEICLTCQKKQL